MDGERGHAVGDDLLVDQRARGVVQQHAAVGRIAAVPGDGLADRGQRHPGGLRPGRAAFDDGRDLAVAGVREHGPDLLDVSTGHEHEHLVDTRRLLEGRHAVLDQRPAAQPQQLLGQWRADPLTRTAAQHRRDHPHDRDSNAPGRQRTGPAAQRGQPPGPR
jgi:hypothetical protein